MHVTCSRSARVFSLLVRVFSGFVSTMLSRVSTRDQN